MKFTSHDPESTFALRRWLSRRDAAVVAFALLAAITLISSVVLNGWLRDFLVATSLTAVGGLIGCRWLLSLNTQGQNPAVTHASATKLASLDLGVDGIQLIDSPIDAAQAVESVLSVLPAPIDDAEQAGLHSVLEQALAEHPQWTHTYRVAAASGVRTLKLCARIERNEHSVPARLIAIITDVTELADSAARFKAEADERRELLELLHTATAAADVGLFSCDFADNLVSAGWNMVEGDRRYRLEGYPGAGNLSLSRMHPDDRAGYESALEEARVRGNRLQHRYRSKWPDGIRYLQTTGRVERDANGIAVKLVGAVQNVTQQVLAENEIARRITEQDLLLERLNLATQAASLSVWDWDIGTDRLSEDVATNPIVSSAASGKSRLLGSAHNDDRPALEDKLNTALQTGQGFSHRYQLAHSGTESRFVQIHARVLANAAGVATRVLGVTLEITAEVEREKLLKAQAAEQRVMFDRMSVATQSAGISPWEFDLSSGCFSWDLNRPKAFGLEGRPVAEVGLRLREIIHPDDYKQWMIVFNDALAGGSDLFSHQFRVARPGHPMRHMQTYARVLRDGSGQPQRVLGATWDITNEVQTTDLLQREATDKRLLLDRLAISTGAAGISTWERDLTTRNFLWLENPIAALPSHDLEEMNTFQRLHPDDRKVMPEAIAQAQASNGDKISYRVRVLGKDDQWVHLQCHAKLIFDADKKPIRALGSMWNISEEVAAAAQLEQQAQQLREAQRRLERASLSSSEGHWEWDLADGTAWWSSSHHTLLGYQSGELPTSIQAATELIAHPDDLERLAELYRRHIKLGEPYEFDTRMRHANGQYRWIRVRGMADRDSSGRAVAMAGSIQDVHEQKQIEDALKHAQQRFERAIHGTQDGLWELELDTHTSWCSPRIGELLGYPADEFSTASNFVHTYLHPEDRPKIREVATAHVRHDVPYDIEVRLRCRNGDYRWYRARAKAARNARGEALRLSGSLQDVTDARLARDELVRAIEAAESANRAKSTFLANVSHEIRTPMNGILGMTGLMLETPLDRTQREYAETIRASADSLLTVINDILDLSKIEAGKLDIESIEMDLRGNVEDVGAMMAFQAAAKNLELIVNVHPEVPERVLGDPQRIRQCLINLVGNAIKFTRSGEIVLEVCNVGRRDGKVVTHFEVRDTGIGIDAATQRTLFQPFVQADSSTTRHFGGTGLGLSIVRRLVEMMAGQVGVESEPGLGSTFWFTLPMDPINVEKPASHLNLNRVGRRILVVDDNRTNRRVVQTQLMHEGYEVDLAAGGAEALTLMTQSLADNRLYDVVLADYQMPDMDGAMLGERINADPHLSRARMIMLTSLDRYGDIHRFAALGFAGYLTKPIRARELLDCLDRVLAREAREWHMKTQPLITHNRLTELAGDRRYSGRVLLVEDNAVNQKVAVRFLERLGCTVRVADNGAEGVRAQQEEEFRIIFMDMQMPIMDGLAATRAIRELETAGRRIPIVALTANAMAGQLERCLEAGMDAFLTKPLDIARLKEVLDRFGLDTGESPPSVSPSRTDEPPPVDLASLNEITADDHEFARELATTFLDSAEQALADICNALAASDRSALSRAAHKLKGACANVHAIALLDAAQALEQQSKSADTDALRSLQEALGHELKRTRQFLEAQISTTERAKAS